MWNGAISQKTKTTTVHPILNTPFEEPYNYCGNWIYKFKTFEKTKSPGPYGSNGEFYQIFKEEAIAILLNLFQKIKEFIS